MPIELLRTKPITPMPIIQHGTTAATYNNDNTNNNNSAIILVVLPLL